MKRKIGDKVRVRRDLIVGKIYGRWGVNDLMIPYLGEEATITDITCLAYELDIDEDYFYWTDEMLEDVDLPEKIEESNIECLLKQLLDEDLLTLKGRELVKDYFNN